MRSNDVRMRMFTKNWPVRGHAKPREMEDAGFYYLGDIKLVICFYCAGGLKKW